MEDKKRGLGSQKASPSGTIEVDLFPENVNSVDHPEMVRLKRLLLQAADEYRCRLLSFGVQHGTVSFSFDSDELTAEVLKMLQSRE